MSDKTIITVELTNAEAMALAQLVKRAGFRDYRSNAIDETEAYRMIAAAGKIREALAEQGYAPR